MKGTPHLPPQKGHVDMTPKNTGMSHLVDCTKLDDWMNGVGWTTRLDARPRTLGPGREASDGQPQMDGTTGWRFLRMVPEASALGHLLTGSFLFVAHSYVRDKDGWHVKAIGTSPTEICFNKYPRLDARFNAVFNKAMVNHTTIVMKEILERYHGFKNIKNMVDVGGGLGVTLNMIVSKHPTIKGINFDQPHVIHRAPIYPGIEHIGGDMFDCVPQGDVIFMKDTGSATKVTTHLDTMLMTKYTGKERTEDEYLALFKGAGFSRLEKKCLLLVGYGILQSKIVWCEFISSNSFPSRSLVLWKVK
nr:caffeic acid 3-O-methyltransferase-like [Tanacetum cinerariifolium]